MAFGSDDLTRPLGIEAAPRRRLPSIPWGMIAGTLGLAIIALIAAVILFVTNPDGGQPVAVAPILRQPAPALPASVAAPDPGTSREAPLSRESSTAAELERDAGVSVVRGGGDGAPGAVVIRVPDPPRAIRLAPAPDPRLVENGPHGPLPRIGTGGARPFDVYKRPLESRAAGSGRPRVAILIGGMGLNEAGTRSAISRLPDTVSLAFAPYATDLPAQAARARADGHEVFLQVPMESFDHAGGDPGPHTLRSASNPQENLDRLRWLMSRMTGYVGIVNYLGARLMAEPAAISPVLNELGRRGLAFVDDGSSARSIAMGFAPAARAPAARAEVVIDAVTGREAVNAALARLEAAARANGAAIGTASALPATIEDIARWAATLEARGVDLVPVSAIIAGRDR